MQTNTPSPLDWVKSHATWFWQPYREDRRSQTRIPSRVDVEITLPMGAVTGRTINVSRGGVGVRVPAPMMPGAVVFVRITAIDRSAYAMVRHRIGRGHDYEVGLQFREGLKLEDMH